ncbi:MAG TPA: aminotransferase class IV [Acidimicrobiia bacterium]|nr:aminotransferase class IV [Acidimicrobiia bacterium]
MRVIIDGEPFDSSVAAISVFDWALIRGLAVFEVVRVYGSSLFRLGAHLDRLAASAAALAIAFPERGALVADMSRVASSSGDGQVRVILTSGGRDPEASAPPRVVVMWEPLPTVPDGVSVFPVIAPWHPATVESGFPGVKWTSYAPNMAVTDRVRRLGFDDALLTTTDGIVLEGPTFTYAWMRHGRLETPSLDLGILPSITRDVILECAGQLGLPVSEGRFPLAAVLDADEVLALSTVKQVTPVVRVGDHQVPGGPLSGSLSAAFARVVAAEIAAAGATP